MTIEDLALGIALIAVGVATSIWSLVGDTYDDRLEDRSFDRLRRLGSRSDPLPVTPIRRVFGVAFGLLVAAAGLWWLATR